MRSSSWANINWCCEGSATSTAVSGGIARPASSSRHWWR